MVKRRNAKKPQIQTELEAFNAEFMTALNEKFKLRSQLAALMNQLEEMRARHEHLVDSIKDYLAENSPQASLGFRQHKPEIHVQHAQNKPEVMRSIKPPVIPVVPPKPTPLHPQEPQPAPNKAIQTSQPEPPPLFIDSPIRGLPPIIPAHPTPIELAKPPPNIEEPAGVLKSVPGTPTAISMYNPQEIFLTESFESRYSQTPFMSRKESPAMLMDSPYEQYMPDDIVTVVRKQPRANNTNDLDDELKRLGQRFDEITFYALLIIFIIFGCMLMKEVGLMLFDKYWPVLWQPGIPSYDQPVIDSEREDRCAITLHDAELKLLEALEASPESASVFLNMKTAVCPCPTSEHSPQCPITLAPLEPLKGTIEEYHTWQGPLFEQSILIKTKYDCDECNNRINFGKSPIEHHVKMCEL